MILTLKMFNTNLCTIYVVRHGETDWNVKRLTQGHTDIPLNTNGETQAKELGEQLSDIKLTSDGIDFFIKDTVGITPK